MADDEAMTIVCSMLQLFLKPVQLAFAMGAVARIKEDVEILKTTNGLYSHRIGRGVEILFVERGAVEVHVVVADDGEARVVLGLGLGIVSHSLSRHAETRLAALVHQVAGMDGENGHRVVALSGDVFVKSVVLALRDDAVALGIVRVGAGIYMIFIGCVLNDGHPVLVVIIEPVGHTFLCVAAVDDHASHVKTIAARGQNRSCR